MSSFDYHTFVDGKGYCFTLPALGLPDVQGEWVTIDAALTTNQLDSLDALSKAMSSSSPRRMRSPSEDAVTIDVEHQGALWLLPILPPVGKEDPQAYSLRVRRLPARKSSDLATRLDPLTQAAEALSLGDPASVPPLPPSPANCETASSACPLPSALETSAAVARGSFDEEQDSTSSDSTEQSAAASQTPLPPAFDPNAPLRSQIPGSALPVADALGPLSLNFRYKSAFNWHYKFARTILHLQYVDVLPRGDPIPEEHQEYHRQAGENWSVDFAQRILYHKPAIEPPIRTKVWQDLLTVGLECRISNDIVSVDLGLPRASCIRSPSPQLCAGAARIKVLRNPSNYACQPTAASAEASYFLNSYQLQIEQDGQSFAALCPLAENVDPNDEIFLCLLGQAASAAATGAAARMVFEQRAPKLQGVAKLFNVGVRLRDGGSRHPIISRGRNRKRLLMPGKALWHEWYTDSDLGVLKASKVEQEQKKEVTLRMAVPPGKQDIVFRVRDREEGAYEVLEAAFRAHGSFQPIAEGEWQRVGARELDEWAVEFLVNLARESAGYKKPGSEEA